VRIFTWQMAEELAQGHMQELGFGDSRRTPVGADDGMDVVSGQAIAQVKHQSQPVGSPEIQRLRGAAFHVDHALFYSSSGYTEAAKSFADSRDVSLFAFDAGGDVEPANSAAALLVESRRSRLEQGVYRQKSSLLQQSLALFTAIGAMSQDAVAHQRGELARMEGVVSTVSDASSDEEVRAATDLLRPRAAAIEQFRLRHANLLEQLEAVQVVMMKYTALGTSVPIGRIEETLQSLTAQHSDWATLLQLDDTVI
jgi:hypothetical protein